MSLDISKVHQDVGTTLLRPGILSGLSRHIIILHLFSMNNFASVSSVFRSFFGALVPDLTRNQNL